MNAKLINSIKAENSTKLLQKGGDGFLKHELQASDVRLKVAEGIKLISMTKKYLSGGQRKALVGNDHVTEQCLKEQKFL